jgi:predicted restriction endonuclease
MPMCAMKGCTNFTQYKETKQIYCQMHLARVRRHGYPEKKTDAYQSLEKMPHEFVDNFIIKNCEKMLDIEIANKLNKLGFKGADQWTVRYRRRRLGIKKYLYGDILKHKAWIRAQAIKAYGSKCELCGYRMALETHHIKSKKDGGPHEIKNLTVLCPNCHALLTRKVLILENRDDLPKIRRKVIKMLKSYYKGAF